MINSGKMYTAKEAAQLLGLSQESLRVYARRYNVGSKLGRDWFFSEKEVKAIQKRMGKRGRPKS